MITWRATRGGELHPGGVTIRLRDILDGPLKNRTFLYTMGLYAAASVGLSSAAATMVYFMKYYMHFNETQESLAFLFLFACTILWIPVISKLSVKYGKREAYMLFIGLWVVIQAAGMMLLTPTMIIPFYAMMVVASSGVMPKSSRPGKTKQRAWPYQAGSSASPATKPGARQNCTNRAVSIRTKPTKTRTLSPQDLAFTISTLADTERRSDDSRNKQRRNRRRRQ